ncbi:cystatin-A2-like [Glandiceps talaboti]
MAMTGGMKPAEQATADVQELINAVRSAAEEKSGRAFGAYEAKAYSTQLVNGVNYFVKVHTGDDKYVHIRLHKAFSGTVTFSNLQDEKIETDELVYF